MPRLASLTIEGHAANAYLRWPCRGPLLLQKVAKQVFIVSVTDQRSVTLTHLGSRGFISWLGMSI